MLPHHYGRIWVSRDPWIPIRLRIDHNCPRPRRCRVFVQLTLLFRDTCHETDQVNKKTTPRFRRPPVIETVLGVQFDQLPNMRVVHFGLFWELVKNEFPTVEERNSLEPELEQFEQINPAIAEKKIRWRISDRPDLPRVWFLGDDSRSGKQLIQLQSDRFLQNWRRESPGAQSYPSYQRNREKFQASFQRFVSFAKAADLGEVKANQCEVTYVNQISIPPEQTIGEFIGECFPILSGSPSDAFLPSFPERAAFSYSYTIEDNRGRLHVQGRPNVVKKTGEEFFDLRLTARGAPSGPDIESVMKWLDLGHAWVVNGFQSFTSKTMHMTWEIDEQCATP